MKKLVSVFAIAALLCSGIAALADEATYSNSDNSVGANAGGYTAVLITNDESGDIVYADQADSAFGSAAKFLIKENPAEGYYTLTLGGAESGTPQTAKFYIGTITPEADDNIESDVSFVEENDDNTYNAGYGWESVDGSKVGAIVLEFGNSAMGYDIGTVFTEGSEISVGIKITDIPDGKTITKAYLSEKNVAELKKN